MYGEIVHDLQYQLWGNNAERVLILRVRAEGNARLEGDASGETLDAVVIGMVRFWGVEDSGVEGRARVGILVGCPATHTPIKIGLHHEGVI